MFYSPESRFQLVSSYVLKLEGKLSNHQKDPGGITNYGISLRFLKASGIDIDCDGDIDADDVLAINKEKAREIYRKKWWDAYGYDRIQSIEVAKRVLGFSINMGPKSSGKILQKAINSIGHSKLAVDGIVGIKTIAAANMCDENKLVDAIKKEAICYYKRIVEANPNLKDFLNGWINRANA